MSEAGAAAIHKADPAVRRNSLLLVLVCAGLLFGGWHWFQSYLDRLPVETPEQMGTSARLVAAVLDGVLYGCALLLAGLALYWLRQSRIIAAAASYPLPHMRLFHDMKILSGAAKQAQARRSRRLGIVGAAGALLLLCAAALLPSYLTRLHPLLVPGAAPPDAAAASGRTP
ncbi:MAG: hypothetical protein P4L83_02605 [Nevskia sp.]|nr:hypothetical protein [Nevskia sp.]